MVCFSNLLLEIVLTRLFSATMYYHFTFLAIALALFGIAASGVYVYVHQERFPAERAQQDLAHYSRWFAGTTVLTLVYAMANPIAILTNFSKQTLLQLLLLQAVAVLPFFCAGMVVTLALTHYRLYVDRVYFWDLLGAGLAPLTAGVLLGLFGGPSLVLLLALLAAFAATLFHSDGWVPVGILALLFGLNLAFGLIAVPPTKGEHAGGLLFEKWNAFSRITVDSTYNIRIDALAATQITPATPVPNPATHDVSNLVYAMFGRPARPLIIGAGGGRDLVGALDWGCAQVVGIEINPIIYNDVMRGRFAEQSQRLYFDPRVTVHCDEGRSFVRRSSERFDVIQASMVDTWAAQAAGAFALTENSLYTVEAFEDYFEHLTDDGAITMTRWLSGAEMSRMVLLGGASLERRGVPAARTRDHLFVAAQGDKGTVIIRRNPFGPAELDRLEQACAQLGIRITLSPRTDGSTALEQLLAEGSAGRSLAALPQDMSAPTDDRPFFFYYSKPGDLLRLSTYFVGNQMPLNNPSLWLIATFGAVLALTCFFVLLPLFTRRADLRGGRGVQGALTYFGCLGLGFILVELALLQKLSFFLGHPTYGLVVVLFSLLLATSLGAAASARIPDGSRARAILGLGLVIAGLAATYAMVLPPLLRAWVAWPFGARVLLAVAVVGVLGLLLGCLLPLGMRVTTSTNETLVPWGWGVNGATSVLGTVLATVLALHFGFTVTLLAGALTYVVAAAVGYSWATTPPNPGARC